MAPAARSQLATPLCASVVCPFRRGSRSKAIRRGEKAERPWLRAWSRSRMAAGLCDGNDLVIETSHFAFDPDGTDDHLGMASSVRKKVTERYRLIDNNNLRLIITLEDPIFLTRPFTYAFIFTKTGSDGPRQGWRECDADSARREQEYAYPATKYPDAR